MKKIISLITVLAMLLCAFSLLVACNDEEPPASPSNESNQSTGGIADKNNNGTLPDIPVAVDSVGGKNSMQLYEAYVEKCRNSTTLDILVTSVSKVEQNTVTSLFEMKVSDSSMYISMSGEGENLKLWYVDGVSYVDSDGEKVKMSAPPSYILGEDFLDGVFGNTLDPDNMPSLYKDRLENAQLYKLGDTYYMTISFTEQEIDQMDTDVDIPLEETLYFDKDGNLIKGVASDGTTTSTTEIRSLGGTVTVSAPSNASEFTDASGTGSVDPQVYAIYSSLFDAVSGANAYVAEAYNNGEVSYEYGVDRTGDEYMAVTQGNTQSAVFVVGGKLFLSVGASAPVETQMSPELQNAIDNARQTRQMFLSLEVPSIAMQSIEHVTDVQSGQVFVTVVVSGTQTIEYALEYTLVGDKIDSVSLDMEMYEGGVMTSNVGFAFYELTNSYFDIAV